MIAIIKKTAGILLFVYITAFFFTCSAEQHQEQSFNISSVKYYRDLPGITDEEIEAIESIKASRKEFIYAVIRSTEAFILPDGTYTGFAAMFSSLLSELFDIPFILKFHTWTELKNGIDDETIDFTGEMTPTPGRMQEETVSRAAGQPAFPM